MSDKPSANLMPALYSYRIHELQAIARANGYAIAIHGSMQRDLDVVAIPWVKNARTPKHLVREICKGMGLIMTENSPGEKPHGRLAYSLIMSVGAGFVDLSVMPKESQ